MPSSSPRTGLYIPTGRYEDGADNNVGLGQWAQETLLGTTVSLTKTRTVHVATTATFDFQSEKEDSGVGGDFLGGGLAAGLAYYATFKLTDDEFDQRHLPLLIQGKNRVGSGARVHAGAGKQEEGGLRVFETVRYPVGTRCTHDH